MKNIIKSKLLFLLLLFGLFAHDKALPASPVFARFLPYFFVYGPTALSLPFQAHVQGFLTKEHIKKFMKDMKDPEYVCEKYFKKDSLRHVMTIPDFNFFNKELKKIDNPSDDLKYYVNDYYDYIQLLAPDKNLKSIKDGDLKIKNLCSSEIEILKKKKKNLEYLFNTTEQSLS
jgi:hypothetical protein